MPAINVMGSFQDPLNLDQGAGKLVNVRVVPREMKEGRVAKVRFLGSPGLTTVCQPTAQPCIALCHALDTIWSGHGDGSIYYGIETGVPVLAGFVAVQAGQPVIRFAEDRTALAIASNKNILNPLLFGTGYVGVKTPTAGITNAGFDTSIDFDPSTVAELDNMTIWSGASNVYANQDSKMYNSNPLAPGTVQPNSFATKEARADRVVDLAISGRVMWPLGSRSLEQWYDSGNGADFPYQAFPNSLNSVGIASRLTLAVLRDRIMFVGTNRRVWLCSGQSGAPVSPTWVDNLLQELTLTQLGQLTAYAYAHAESDFYVLTLPGSWTIELSGATGSWSYRQSPGRLDHASRCATEHDGGSTYVGLDTGHICTADMNNQTEPAGTISRIIVTPWVGDEEYRSTYATVDATSSMGPQAGTFQLDWSETADVTEGGVVVSNRTWRGVRQIQMPTPGVQRAIGRDFGTGRRRQFRLQYSGTQAPFTIDEMFINTIKGT